MKEKTLKPKHKFISSASYVLSRGGSREDVIEMSKEYVITEREVEDYLSLKIKAEAMSGALTGGREIREAIYNTLDQKFIEQYENIVMFTRGENIFFYEYVDGVYSIILDIDMYNRVDSIMAQYALFDYRSSSRTVKDTVKRIGALLSRTEGRYFTEKNTINRKWYLNLKNGLLDMDTFKLKEHTPEYFSTVQVPYEYNIEAKCPEFMEFLEKVSKKTPSAVVMIHEMFGYCLMEGNPRHKIFYLYGDIARNGKSTTAKILCGLIGMGNVSTLSLEQMAGENSAILTSMVGKQLNFSDETSNKFIDSSRLTSMSAEGIVEINPKFKTSFLYQIKSKFIVCCNNLPRFKESQGMKHRMISIPFSLHIPEEERIYRYEEILLEKEGSGILNWAIEGSKIIKNQKKFSINDESREDMYDNMLESNSTYAYLENIYDFSDSHETIVHPEDLYGNVGDKNTLPSGYRLFCYNRGTSPGSYITFCKELKRFERETNKIKQTRRGTDGTRYYTGLKNKTLLESEDLNF